jgi:hypothetical protein
MFAEFRQVDLERKRALYGKIRQATFRQQIKTMQDFVSGNLVDGWTRDALAARNVGMWQLPDGTPIRHYEDLVIAAKQQADSNQTVVHKTCADAWTATLKRLDAWQVSYPAWYHNYAFKMQCSAERMRAFHEVMRQQSSASSSAKAASTTMPVHLVQGIMSTQLGEELQRRETKPCTTSAWLKAQRDPAYDQLRPVSSLFAADICQMLSVISDTVLFYELLRVDPSTIQAVLNAAPVSEPRDDLPEWLEEMIAAENASNGKRPKGAASSSAKQERDARMEKLMQTPAQVEARNSTNTEDEAMRQLRTQQLAKKEEQDRARATAKKKARK